MLESPQNTTVETQTKNVGRPLFGWATLSGVFFIAAGLTWMYLVHTTIQPTTATAAAVVSQENVVPPPIDTSVFSSIALVAKSAIVVDETTDQVLYALHADAQWPLASLTKVPLVLVVGEAMSPQSTITVPFDTGYNSHGGSFHKGEHWKLQDIIDFTLAVSSNEGADMLAQIASAPIRSTYPLSPESGATLWRMNNLAASLQLSHTYFLNDNGLDLSPTQSGAYGSARDVASLFAYAAQTMPSLFSATTKQSFTLTSLDGSKVEAKNTDDALPAIPNIIMGKTGYTDLAGGNLAICFRTTHLICAAVLGSTFTGRFSDIEALAEATKKAYATTTSI